jgi:hypothetical protein
LNERVLLSIVKRTTPLLSTETSAMMPIAPPSERLRPNEFGIISLFTFSFEDEAEIY